MEAKWHSDPIGRGTIASHLVSVYGRGDVYGLFVSFSPFTDPAIKEVSNALTKKVVVLADVYELLLLLENPDASISEWLKEKVTAARIDREPLFRPGIPATTG